MPSILFGELPLVTSEAELAAVKAANPSLDSYFVASACCQARRERFEALWPAFEPHADPNFLQQLQQNGHFHQRTWEMYLGNVLLKKGLKLVHGRNLSPPIPQGEGPDFVAESGLYIECVAPTQGAVSNPDAVPDIISATVNSGLSWHTLPENEILLRITQSIKEKSDKYSTRWAGKRWFSSDAPYIIAVNIGLLGHIEDPNMPYGLKSLFGATAHISFGDKVASIGYHQRDHIQRSAPGSADVPVNYFSTPDFSHISGAIFSNTTVVNHPPVLGDDCFFVNNPYAARPVTDALVSKFGGWSASLTNGRITLTPC